MMIEYVEYVTVWYCNVYEYVLCIILAQPTIIYVGVTVDASRRSGLNHVAKCYIYIYIKAYTHGGS